MTTNLNYKSTPSKNLDVLIVEDEPDICYLLSSILKRRDFNISYVMSLSEAKRELSTINPDILFIDNHLPDGLGINFISDVKKRYPLIKIVMITAHDSGDDESRALTKGADYFIGKPFTTNIIMETVDNLLQVI